MKATSRELAGLRVAHTLDEFKRREAELDRVKAQVIETLRPFDQETRRRILKAAAILLGQEDVVP